MLVGLLLVFTFQSVHSDPVRDTSVAISPGGLLEKINSQSNGEYFYKYLFNKIMKGFDKKKANVSEYYYQETNCRKADVNKINDIKACHLKPDGKIMVCHIKSAPVDISNCKTTGDEYELPKNDRRTEYFALQAAKAYEDKYYDRSENSLGVSLAVIVVSDLKRKVVIGTENILQFLTKEVNCTNPEVKRKCTTTKPRLDCEATVFENVVSRYEAGKNRFQITREIDVNCEENKSSDAIKAMKGMPCTEKKVCKVIIAGDNATSDVEHATVTRCLWHGTEADDDDIGRNASEKSEKPAGSVPQISPRSADSVSKKSNNAEVRGVGSEVALKDDSKANKQKWKAKKGAEKNKPKNSQKEEKKKDEESKRDEDEDPDKGEGTKLKKTKTGKNGSAVKIGNEGKKAKTDETEEEAKHDRAKKKNPEK